MASTAVPDASRGTATGGRGLARRLSGLTTGAMTYACVGATAGIFSLFAFSLSSSGPAFFWGWIIVSLSLLMMCLVYAELASHYPYAGSLYQWPLRLAGRRTGWWIGWMYLGALLALLPSYAIVMPAVLNPLFGWTASTTETVVISVGLILLCTVLNLLGIELLGRLSAIGVVVELGVLVVLSLLVFILGPHHGPGELFNSGGTGATFGDWLPGFIGGGMFVGLWALFTFETAGTLGEETIDAKRQAPRAILGAWAVTVGAGICFLVFFLLSIPDLPAAMKSGTPVQDIIDNVLPTWVVKLYLVLIAWTLLLAANALFTGMSRHIFSMARDGQLPFSGALSRTRANGVPWVAALVICVLASLPLIVVTSDLTVLVTGAIAAMYVPYVLVMAVSLGARLRGWPHGEPAPFSLGRWGIPVNVAGLVCAALTLLNLAWARDATNPAWKLDIRVTYWLIGIPLLVGIVYYPLKQHRRLSREPEPAVAELG
jgi:amino acid transporter